MATVPRKTTLVITEYSVDSMLNAGRPVTGICDQLGNISTGIYGVASCDTTLRVPQNMSPGAQISTLFVNSGATNGAVNYTLGWSFDITINGQFVFSIAATNQASGESTTLWKSPPQSEGVISGNFSLRLNADSSLTLKPAEAASAQPAARPCA